jgi:phosphatidylserine/phosphatidylglycerophosphate/cardiolipin synthase-like enzyme
MCHAGCRDKSMMMGHGIMSRLLGALAGLAMATACCAGELQPFAGGAPATAQVRVAFTPGDDIAGEIVDAIRQARKQVLVQAFSFTHGDIARALIEAHKRGIEVKLIADREQTENMRRGQVTGIARAGVPVWLDGAHQSAHNKVMVIDAGRPNAQIITGSYNFTRAAQHKNAENVVFISGDDALIRQYVANWQHHQAHAQPLVLH